MMTENTKVEIKKDNKVLASINVEEEGAEVVVTKTGKKEEESVNINKKQYLTETTPLNV
jgi:hypothetical protein